MRCGARWMRCILRSRKQSGRDTTKNKERQGKELTQRSQRRIKNEAPEKIGGFLLFLSLRDGHEEAVVLAMQSRKANA